MIALIYNESKNPDDRAFMLTLYQEYKRLMYYTANRFCSNPYDCEEIVHDTILKLIQKVEVLRNLEKNALAAYISVSVRNTAFSLQRRQAKERAIFALWPEELESIPDPSMTAEDSIIWTEKKEALLVVWELLSEQERFLLEGRYILRYTDSELAQVLGGKPDSIRMKLTRVRRKALKLMIMHEEGEEKRES